MTFLSSSNDKINTCKCDGVGAVFSVEEAPWIRATNCSCNQDWDVSYEELFDYAEVPAASLQASAPSQYRDELLGWLEDHNEITKTPFVFFHGGTGTGKTFSACFMLRHYLIAHRGKKSGAYLALYDVIGRKREAQAYSFDAKRVKDKAEHDVSRDKRKMLACDLVVLDEFGQERLTEKEENYLFELLDKRVRAGKPTIFISNHCEDRELSLDGKLLSELLGKRVVSRLSAAKSFYFEGGDLRGRNGEITKEEIANFKMPAKLMTIDDNTHHIMRWLARNPAFEVVEKKRRALLTAIDKNGKEYDLDRTEPSIYENVWIEGDYLEVRGPVCDEDDRKLYVTLMKDLTNSHKHGNSGLTLETSEGAILRSLGMTDSGKNYISIRRRLDRLNRANLRFKGFPYAWQGPLLTEIHLKQEENDTKLILKFSEFTLKHYKLQQYLLVNKAILDQIKGYSPALYYFFQSHDSDPLPITLKKCAKIFNLPANMPTKEANRRIKSAIEDLTEAGAFNSQGTFIKNGKLHVSLKRAT